MRQGQWMVAVTALVLTMAGCEGSADSASDASGGANQAESAAESGGDREGATKAVAEFLSYYKAGDDARITAMLTSTAQQLIQEYGVHLAPIRSDTATFAVGQVELQTEDGARVYSTFTDGDGFGGQNTVEQMWMVRKEPNGWRIAGGAVKVAGEYRALDFESREHLAAFLARQQAAEAETPPDAQAQAPEDPNGTYRR